MEKKKRNEIDCELEGELLRGAARPTRNSNNSRKNSAARSSHKRSKRSKSAKRKGNISGGIHLRGDKRVSR